MGCHRANTISRPAFEGGAGGDEGEALDVSGHVADGDGGHRAGRAETDEDRPYVLEPQCAADVRLKHRIVITIETVFSISQAPSIFCFRFVTFTVKQTNKQTKDAEQHCSPDIYSKKKERRGEIWEWWWGQR